MITQAEVKDLFEYHPDGWLIRIKGGKNRNVGDVAGGFDVHGYHRIKIRGVDYKTHQLVFLYHNGYVPLLTDHINRDISDNRIENLRAATPKQNSHNRKRFSGGTSIYKGVSKCRGKWRAIIYVDGIKTDLGRYADEIEAARVYDQAAHAAFGSFAVLNRPWVQHV